MKVYIVMVTNSIREAKLCHGMVNNVFNNLDEAWNTCFEIEEDNPGWFAWVEEMDVL